MDVVSGVLGDVEIDHVPDSPDVEPTGRDVRGHEYTSLPVPEARQAAIALLLGLRPVQVVRRDAAAAQILGQITRGIARPGEHQHLPR